MAKEEKEQGVPIEDLAVVGGEGAKTSREWCFEVPEDYPMKPDNPCKEHDGGRISGLYQDAAQGI